MADSKIFTKDDFSMEEYDPSNTFPSSDHLGGNAMNNYHEHLEDEINEEDLIDESNRINKLPASGSKKRWEKGQTSRLKSSIGELRLINITINNPNKMMILRCLYMSRSLDIFQIARVAVPDMNMKALGNMMSSLTGQRLVKRTLSKAQWKTKGDEQKYHYSLDLEGLYIIACYYLDAEWFYDNRDIPKQHYFLANLNIADTQLVHHFEIQDLLTRLIHNLAIKGINFPHCEWRRYPLQDPRIISEKFSAYKPDWILFEPNNFYSEMFQKQNTGMCPLHTPILSRDEDQKKTLKDHYKIMLSLECDMKTEDSRKLEYKFERFKYSLSYQPNNLAFFSVFDRLLRDELKPLIDKRSKNRLRNNRMSMIKVMGENMIAEQTTILHGDEYTCRIACEFFIEHEGNMRMGFPTSEEFASYVNAGSYTTDHSLSYYSPIQLKEKRIGRPLPVIPDAAVRVEQWGKTKEMHLIFFARLGWVNPIAKAIEMQKWINEGDEGNEVKVVLLYPNAYDIDNEIHMEEFPFYYVNWEEVMDLGIWGHYKVPEKVKTSKNMSWKDVKP
ncbi:hypothetical protein [Paenibacillus sp. GP183]|uniref:hypothetical protein n=1 Tax=Paenibacillus sp. GP183 TaxID=1882751 RepID=UPI00089CB809|nr:hypothetical protein [Paenibacillus sp. GP183]SED12569.1 hypothetical protein SAMN05443246_5819 [Paenibacillus sp. GP183]